MKKRFGKTLLICALSLASFAASAAPFNDFTVAEGSVPGMAANTFTADKITGNYIEDITFTSASTFSVSLLWNAGEYAANNGSTIISPTQLNGFHGYGLYGLYRSTGTFSTTAGITTFNNNPGGSLNVYIDPLENTLFTNPGSGTLPWITGNAADDYLIATGVSLSGQGQLDPFLSTCGGGGINCGSFGTSTTFSLTGAGSSYFTSPSPFYELSFQSGQLDNFSLSGTQIITGSLDATFAKTPEPAGVALVGLGLLGLFLARRKSLK